MLELYKRQGRSCWAGGYSCSLWCGLLWA